MIYILGLVVSCIITGYVYLKILDELYERKYVEKKWIYYLAVIIHILLNTVEALVANPMLNLIYSLMVLCVGSVFLYVTEKKEVLVNSVIIVIYIAIMDLVVTTLFSTLTQNNTYIALNEPRFFLVSGIANALAILCTWRVFSQILKKCKISNVSIIMNAYMVFLLVFEFSLLLYLLQKETDVEHNGIILVICIGFASVDAGVIYLFERVSYNFELEKKTELLEQQRELFARYYESLQERFQDSQKMLHDMKRHLQVLSSMGKTEKVMQEEYANKLLEEIEDIQKQFQCSDRIVCCILWDKMQICNHDNIELDINMQDIRFDFMEKTDVTVLFANLLDNAIDASKECKHGRRKIFLRIHKFKDYVVIKMINTMAQTPKLSNNKLVSTKREHTGLGINILTDLVNKYCGNMNYSYTDREFETKIILSTSNRV